MSATLHGFHPSLSRSSVRGLLALLSKLKTALSTQLEDVEDVLNGHDFFDKMVSLRGQYHLWRTSAANCT